MTDRPRTIRIARAAVAALALGLYAGTLGHGFAYDDAIVIENQTVVREHRLLDAFTTPYHVGPTTRVETGAYRPLTILSFSAQHALHGAAPAPYHAVNVALHAIASLLVLELALALGLSVAAAGLAGALFAAHPVHAEAVAAIAGRADLLAAVFFLSALLVWIRRRDPASGLPSRSGAAGTALLALAAVLSKESAIVFPAVALAWDALAPRGARRPRPPLAKSAVLVPTLALVAPVAVYLAARGAILGGLFPADASITPIENPVVGLGPLARIATATAILGRNALLLVFPARLSPDWGGAEVVPVLSPIDPWLLLGAATVAITAVAFLSSWRRSGATAFAIALAAIAYLLVSNLVVTIGTGMAERLLYLPSVGFLLAVAIVWGSLEERRGRAIPLALALVVLLAAAGRTVVAAAAWRDDFTLFSAAERAAPKSLRVLNNLGVALAERGRLDEARLRLERAVALAPAHVPSRINLAGALLAQGDLRSAERQARRALAIEPDNPIALAQMEAIRRAGGEGR